MSKPAKLKLTIYQGATFRKRLRWSTSGGTLRASSHTADCETHMTKPVKHNLQTTTEVTQ